MPIWRRYLHGKGTDVDAIDADRAFAHVVEPANQVHQRALAGAAGADQPDHLARANRQVDALHHRPVAVLETDVLQFDLAADFLWMNGIGRFRDGGNAVQNLEHPLRSGAGPLRGGHHAAHRIQPRVEAADVIDKGHQHADAHVIVQHAISARSPDDEQPQLGEQRDAGDKQRPGAVDAVIDLQDVFVRSAETRDFALFLGESLDDADARNRIGQHAHHPRQCPASLVEAASQTGTHSLNHPGNQRERAKREQGQHRVDRKQDDRRHRDHQQVVAEVEQVHRQEGVNPVGVVADARHQVAGAFAAEELQRELLQVGVRGVAHVGGDAFADPGQRERAPQPNSQERNAAPAMAEMYQLTNETSTLAPDSCGISTLSNSGIVR